MLARRRSGQRIGGFVLCLGEMLGSGNFLQWIEENVAGLMKLL